MTNVSFGQTDLPMISNQKPLHGRRGPYSGLSKAEQIKAASYRLRGSVAEELENGAEAFRSDTLDVLKHHGTYQHDDRDLRGLVLPDGSKLPRVQRMMVRSKITGGRLTADQMLTHLDICDELGNGTLRATTRQDFQLHGVPKRHLKEAIRRINQALLTTLGACGDINRNVMCCPAPYEDDPAREQIRRMAESLSSALTPSTAAYSEIWLSGPGGGAKRDPLGGSASEEREPLYGETYLPRKFKLAISLPDDNCVDVYSHDLGLLAVRQGSTVVGYNVLAGGGFGNTPSNKRTFPALAKPLAFVTPDQVVDVVKAIVKVYRDFGNRSDRKRARLKYLIADCGIGQFKEKVEHYLGIDLPKPWPVRVGHVDDHAGWHEQGDGLCFYGLSIENGRIADRGDLRLKSALRAICQAYHPGIRLTPGQSILLTHLAQKDRLAIERILRSHGVKLSDEVSPLRRSSMACVALPTCPLAITEAERALPGVIDRLERELAELGLSDEKFTVRMTGCPNGCARPYDGDVGLVGRSVGKYAIYLGGRQLGDRLAFLYRDRVSLEEIVPTLVQVLVSFKEERLDGESLGDFCHRKGVTGLAGAAAECPATATGGLSLSVLSST